MTEITSTENVSISAPEIELSGTVNVSGTLSVSRPVIIGDVGCQATGTDSFAQGQDAHAIGNFSSAQGSVVSAEGNASHAGGLGSGTTFVSASGLAAFNHSSVNGAYAGTGASGSRSAILGGNNLEVTGQNSVALGGNGRTVSDSNMVDVPNLTVNGRITVSDDPLAIAPKKGDIRFNDTTDKHEGFDGATWNPFY